MNIKKLNIILCLIAICLSPFIVKAWNPYVIGSSGVSGSAECDSGTKQANQELQSNSITIDDGANGQL